MKNWILVFVLICSSLKVFCQVKNCNGGGGFYTAFLLNPGAQDADDGNVDGNCEYMLNLTLFSMNSPVTFVYTGDGTATPSSTMASFSSAGQVTVVGTCDPVTVAAFDVFFMGNLECQIVNFNLPVALSKFELERQAKGIKLSWETSSELNNEGFIVERSLDGQQWQALDFIKGNGTTYKAQSYHYFDSAPFPGLRYYRLQQRDFDGSSDYSPIIQTYFNPHLQANTLQVFPNPSEDLLRFQLPESDVIEAIYIVDQYGKQMEQWSKENIPIRIHHLPAGIYFLKVRGRKRTYQAKFIRR